MKISMKKLQDIQPIEKVIVHSLDCALYQASVLSGGCEKFVTDKDGKLLRSRSVLEMQAHFKGLDVQAMVLRQASAYDEMVGQPLRTEDNVLEVPLSTEQQLN